MVVPVVRRLVLDLEVGEVLERCRNVLGVLQGGGHPIDTAFEPDHPQSGMTIEDAAEDVLAEGVTERRHGLEHPDADGVEFVRRRRRILSDVV